MARPVKITHEQIARAKEIRDSSQNDKDRRAAIIFLLMAGGKQTAEELAAAFGITLKTVFNDMDRIRNPEKNARGNCGGRNNYLMAIYEEAQFLDEWNEKATAGHIITMPELHSAFNERVGKETPKSTFYRLLKRHGWRKVLPDTRHPKGNPEIQEEFKKKHLNWKWVKLP
jgi:transposase